MAYKPIEINFSSLDFSFSPLLHIKPVPGMAEAKIRLYSKYRAAKDFYITTMASPPQRKMKVLKRRGLSYKRPWQLDLTQLKLLKQTTCVPSNEAETAIFITKHCG